MGVASKILFPIPNRGLSRRLYRLTAPTALIWGRHDLANPVPAAERASVRFGWPLYVIDDAADDPAIERPEAFVTALRAALSFRAAGAAQRTFVSSGGLRT